MVGTLRFAHPAALAFAGHDTAEAAVSRADQSYDAVIVGCGPVGATLANLLASRGLRVAAIDQAFDIYDKPRAISLDHEVMRIFQACGLADAIAPRTAPHPGTHFLGVDGRIIKIFDPMPPPYPLGWPPNLTFVQPELEATLRDAAARQRVDLCLGQRAVCPSSALHRH